MDTNTKAAVLARLYHGDTPRDVSNDFETVSYAQALKLSKQLKQAETDDQLRKLFDLPQASIDLLLQAVKQMPIPEILEGELEDTVEDIATNVQGMQLLETELSSAATTLVKQINIKAASTTNADTILILADAVSKLHTSFFAKNPTVQIANFNGESSGFESMLTD